jgi:hypothetical protein
MHSQVRRHPAHGTAQRTHARCARPTVTAAAAAGIQRGTVLVDLAVGEPFSQQRRRSMYAGGIQPDGDRRDGADRPCRAGRGRPAGAQHAERRAPGDQCRGHDPTGRHSHNRGQRRGPGRLWPDPRPSQDGDGYGGAAGHGRRSRSPGPWGGGRGAGAGRRHPGPRDSVVRFRTKTDVQVNGVVRRLRLEAGQTTATYLVVAPDPPTHPLTVVVTMPRAAQVKVWLETEVKSRVHVVGSRQDPTSCKLAGGQVRCMVRLGRSGPEANLASGPRGSPSTRHRQRWWR